jgi:hypothetical protein
MEVKVDRNSYRPDTGSAIGGDNFGTEKREVLRTEVTYRTGIQSCARSSNKARADETRRVSHL